MSDRSARVSEQVKKTSTLDSSPLKLKNKTLRSSIIFHVLGNIDYKQVRLWKIRLASLTIILGFVLNVGIYYWDAAYRGINKGAFSSYLFQAGDRFCGDYPEMGPHLFGDFYGTWQQTKFGNPYSNPILHYPSNYFPFAHLVMIPFSILDYTDAINIYIFLFVTFSIVYFFLEFRTDSILETVIYAIAFGMMSYPIQFLLDRGNIEGIVFIFMVFFVHFYRIKKFNLAILFLACAGAMKAVPLIFVLIFIGDKNWKAVTKTIIMTGVLTLIGIVTIDGSIFNTINAIAGSLMHYSQVTSAVYQGSRNNLSLRNFFQVLSVLFDDSSLGWIFFELSKASIVFFIILVALTLLALLKQSIRLWERLGILSCFIALFPSHSGDYKLVYFFLPFCALVRDKWIASSDLFAVTLFLLLILPKGGPITSEINLGSLLNPPIILMLFLTIFITSYFGSVEKSLFELTETTFS